jgi:hypothetical protein
LKGILPENHSFQVGEMLILFQVDLSSWVEETHVSLKRKPPVLEAEACSTLLPSENWIIFKGILPEYHSFPGGDRLCLFR